MSGRLEGQREARREQQRTPVDNSGDNFEDDRITDDPFEGEDVVFGDEDDFSDDDDGVSLDDELFEDDDDDDDPLSDLFDDDDEKPKRKNEGDAFERFLAFVEGRDKDKKPDPANDDSFATFFEKIYGEGIDFSSMFDGADVNDETVTTVNEALNGQMKPMFERATRDIMTATMSMVQEHVKSELANVQKAQETASAKDTLKARIVKSMPFLGQDGHKVMFAEMYESIYERTKGNPRETAKLVQKLYRKTNPEKFRNTKDKSFSRPRKRIEGRRNSRGTGNNAWDKWLNN